MESVTPSSKKYVISLRYWCLVVCALISSASLHARDDIRPVQDFVGKYCVECHDADIKKGGLDLTTLRLDLADPANLSRWVKVHDRVAAGEMPPKKKARPLPADLKSFTNSLAGSLLKADLALVAQEGRATRRRLNRHEYEDTLRDLFSLPYLEVKSFLPEDREAYGFNKIGDALDVSHVQMARYLGAAEFALHEAMAPQVERPATTTNRFYTWEQPSFVGSIKIEGPVTRRTFPLVGWDLQTNYMKMDSKRPTASTNAEQRELEAISIVVSTYEPTEIRFNNFRAPVSGRYKLRFSGYSVWMAPNYNGVTKGHRSEPVTIYADTPPRSLRKLGSFDFGTDPTVQEIDTWLLAGETIRPDAARFFRARPPDFINPLKTAEGMPSVAFKWMEVEGPITDQWPPAEHQLLFGKLPITNRVAAPVVTSTNRPNGRRRNFTPLPGVEAVSTQPERDAEPLLRNFMARAYRSPVKEEEVQRFMQLIRTALKSGYSFTDAMQTGYTGVLSSPAFLYLEETPGQLSDRAIADRLAFFLWNSAPDQELRDLAARGRLHNPKTLRQQTDRLLNDLRSRRFQDAFLDYWLDLRLLAATAPDAELYPDYQLDDLLLESMIEESQLFFGELVRKNLPARNLVAANFAMLNERMATLYGLPDVTGVGFRPVALSKDGVRGGLLTQASVLKVTANGTTTSPVKRGAWIMTRILGKPPQPPPPSVPAVEPDIRGAVTIRDQLARHRSEESCSACHRTIDPTGFALESFDVMGGYRERYRATGKGEKVKGAGHNGDKFAFTLGLPVDSTGELWDGRTFHDVRELKQLLLTDEPQLARNLTRQLAVFATGAPIRFSDRPQIERILARSRSSGYGVRTLIHELVQSDMFLHK